MDFLAEKNLHERDSHITFEEGPHIYTIDGEFKVNILSKLKSYYDMQK